MTTKNVSHVQTTLGVRTLCELFAILGKNGKMVLKQVRV